MISGEHKEKCNKCPLRCPNNCGQDDIFWESMDDHKKVCPHEMIQCEYLCGARIARNEVEKHNRDKLNEHIQLANAVLSELKTAQLRSAETNASVPIRPHFTTCTVTVLVIVIAIIIQVALLLPSYCTTCIKDLKFKETEHLEDLTKSKLLVKRLQNEIKDLKTEHLENLTQSKLLVKRLQNEIKDLKTEHLENLTQSKLLVKRLQNEIKDLKTEHLENLKQSRSLVKQLQNEIKDLKAKHSEEFTKSANCKSGELTQTELKLFISDEMSDQVAPVAILKMSDFTKRKENKEQWYSKPFFGFQQGYQMRLGVYADGTGDGEGTHVSVYLYLMKGPHDDKLELSGDWFSGTFMIELLNQLKINDHYSGKVTFKASTPSDVVTGRGYSRFISHDILLYNKIKYLKNDALYFRIRKIVDSEEHKSDNVALFAVLIILFIICLFVVIFVR